MFGKVVSQKSVPIYHEDIPIQPEGTGIVIV